MELAEKSKIKSTLEQKLVELE